MSNSNSTRSHSTRSLKRKKVGTGGKNQDFSTSAPIPCIPGTGGNEWERVGTGELKQKPKQGMFFHQFDAEGKVNHQGHLLELNSKGHGRAQLFEWFWGDPSDVIEVNPDYLKACVFYPSCSAMNAAYAAIEASEGDDD